MTPTDLRTLAADHGAIRADVWRVSAALESAAGEIERLRAALRNEQKMLDYARQAVLADREQRGEPYLYVYEYPSAMGLHREFYPREWNGMQPDRTVPLYAAPPPVEQRGEPVAPDGKLHDDGCFTWNTKKHQVWERPAQLPCAFWLAAPQPVEQRKPLKQEMLRQMRELVGTYEEKGAFVDGWTSAEQAHGIGDKV